MIWVDYVILAIVLASCIVGAVRGLLREVISVISWVLALWLAWHYGTELEPHLGGALADPAVSPWAARVIIATVVVLVGAGLGAIVTHYVRLSIFSGLDRLLGVVFGLMRGAVLVGLLAILSQALRLEGERWYRFSKFAPYAEQTADVLRDWVGEGKITEL